MKKLALFLLLLFAAVQAVPAIRALVDGEKILVFNVDEEKCAGKQVADYFKDSRNSFAACLEQISLTARLIAPVQPDDQLPLHPCLERHTPPPNFC
ncbi:MAG TPA: hypothetical protein VG870_12055 [Chitinophagaceae bacterium]|nr:hypothetical protein [Chitinophagaceae bacterium]